jgi:hypothetical protein
MADDTNAAPSRAFSSADLPAAIRVLEQLLDAVDAGDFTAPPGMVNRLHGALIALQALAGDR